MDVLEQTATDDAPTEATAPPGAKPLVRQSSRKVDWSKAKKLMDRCVTDARNNQPRLDRDRQDWQNLLMYRGGASQWSVYDRATNSYVPRGTDPEQGGLPDWVPRPSTNLFGVHVDQLASLLDQSEPAKQFGPSTDDDEDRATAEVAEDADPVLLEEIGYDRDRAQLNKLACLTNGSVYIIYFDNDPKHGSQQIDLLRCPTCQTEMLPMELEDNGNVCPESVKDPTGAKVPCNTPGDTFEPVINTFGVPEGVPFPKGKMCAQVVPSFEYSLPSTARTADSKSVPWVLTHSEMAPEDIIGRWGEKAQAAIGKTGSRKVGGLQRAYARSMRQLSAPSRANAPVATAGGGGSSAGSGPVVYILHHDPIEDDEFYFPDGLLCVQVEDVVLEKGPLPVNDDEDRAIKPALVRTWTRSPGSCYGKPPADDLVPLQISHNLVDSLIQLILMHDASPRNFIPLSVTLENQPSGRPGENIYYRSAVPGEKPHTEQGINPPEGLYKYLDIIKANFEAVSKLNSVLAGARPEGDPTLGEVQILQERGMAAFKEPLDELALFEKDLSRLCMFIAKRSAWSDRFRRIRGDNGQWEIRKFNASDLNGKIDIQIDRQSSFPKSPLMRMLRTKQALEMGILPPPAQDPELQTKLLIEMDLISLKPSLDVDRKQIAREIDRWKGAHDPSEITPPDPATQELPLHLYFKKNFLKTEEFEDLRKANAPLADAMKAHVADLQKQVAAAQTPKGEAPKTNFSVKADLADPDTRKLFEQNYGLPPTEPPPPPAPEDTRSSVEKGDHSAVHAAVESGALTPAGAVPQPPPANPLGDAVSAGALTPAGAMPQAPRGPSIDELMAGGALAPAPPDVEAPM